MSRARVTFQEGLDAYSSGDFEAAVTCFEAALEAHPDHPRVLEFLGLALMRRGDLGRAIDVLGRAEAESSSGEIAFARGLAERAAERHEAALAAFSRALERGFDAAEATVGKASCLALLEHPRAARDLLEPVLAAQPAHPEALYWLAFAAAREREQEGLWSRAVSALEELLALEEGVSDWLAGRAHFLLASLLDDSEEAFEQAAEHYRAGLAIDPGFTVGHNNLGFLLQRMGAVREAREELLEALVQEPGYPRVHRNLARLYYDRLEESCLREDLEALARRLPPEGQVEAVLGVMLSLMDEARRQAYQDYYDRCHRLKNLLAVSGGRMRRLMRKAEPDAPIQRGLADLHAQHQETYEQLSRDLRMLRPTSREAKAMDLNALCRAVARAARRDADERLEVELSLDPSLPPVFGDREALREVLTNLARNAVEAMGGGGHLTIRTTWDESAGRTLLRVEDEGPGLPPDLLEELFRPGVTTKVHGSGLGLALVRRTVHELRGTVVAGNREEGGACFTIELPAHLPRGDGRRLGLAARPVRLEEADELDVEELA